VLYAKFHNRRAAPFGRKVTKREEEQIILKQIFIPLIKEKHGRPGRKFQQFK
jgi:hypothetical protein